MNKTTSQKKHIKASKWSAILTLIGFLVVASAIIFSLYQLNEMEIKKTDLEKQIEFNKNKVDSLRKEKQNLYNEIAFINAQLEQKRADLASRIAENVLVKSNLPEADARILIHIQEGSQREKALRIKKLLASKGYTVSDNIEVVDVVLSRSQLRFFKKKEEPEATLIVNYLNSIKSENLDVYLNDLSQNYENSSRIPLRYFELWLKKEQ